MKKEYNYIDELTDNSKHYKVKVKVIQKAYPHQSPGKKKIQRLIMKDDKGNTMRGAIFDNDIDSFEQAIVRNGEYEISDASIQKIPEAFRTGGNEFQMAFNGRMKITPLAIGPSNIGPRYTKLSTIPRTDGKDQELIDIIGVLLFVKDLCTVTLGQTQQQVREVVLTNNSNSSSRTLVLSAWNDFAENEIQLLTDIVRSMPVVGFTALRTIAHRGFSVASTMSSTPIREPAGKDADTLRSWVRENNAFLAALQQQVTRARIEPQAEAITPIVDINTKKACTTLQEEKYWIKATIPYASSYGLYLYIGCSKCGRKADVNKGAAYKCEKCKQPDVTGIPRVAFTFEVVDSSGKKKFTVFSREVEALFQQTTEEIHGLYHAVCSLTFLASK